MTNKIDEKLLKQIEILSFEKKVSCFVYGKNFYATKAILKKNNIHINHEYLFINSLLCKMSRREIFSLSNLCEVDYIFSVATATCLMYVSKKILKTDTLSLFGKGVGVAFIDTGISPHADFLVGDNRIKFFKDFVSNKQNMYDNNGHGTFVAGVCSGSGALSKFRFSGVAPKSDIFALKALNDKGEASASKILDAMEWVFENHKEQNIKVVCMSFGSEPLGANDPIMLGAEALWKDGVTVVAAAGNSGPEFQTIKSPGISTKIITVGGIDDNRYNKFEFNKKFFEIANFSSRGPAFRKIKPDVVAPSVDIVSCGNKNFYTTLSGTSVATPMIAGLVCLILEKYPDAKPNQIKQFLLSKGQPLGFEKFMEGYGLPDISDL